MDKIVSFLVLLPGNRVRIQYNFNGFSLIENYQVETLSDFFQSGRSRVIGIRCNAYGRGSVVVNTRYGRHMRTW